MISSDAFTFLFVFGTIFGTFIIVFSIACIHENFKKKQDHLYITTTSTTITNSNDNDNDNGLPSTNRTIAYLRIEISLDDCIALYNYAFASNQNQLTLESKHIVTRVMKSRTTTNVTEEIGEKENITIESSSFVDVELGGNNDSNDNDDNDVGDKTSTTSLRLDHNKEKQQMEMNGTCVICFEEFVKDDVIVWAEDPSCSHIYHKECMVQYLACNAHRNSKQRRLSSISTPTLAPIPDLTNNPCPTCRRKIIA